uniref:Uncharacterized protein n=1 Tax=Parascaris equorum TaxID=6256 RepID=A0A914R7I8_PAREQ
MRISQIDVWKLIKKWILIDKKRRQSYLPSLLQCLRYNFLTVKESAYSIEPIFILLFRKKNSMKI